MARAISDATKLRSCKAQLARLQTSYRALKEEQDGYISRATKAERECAEWKARFDRLLTREYATVDGTAVCVCNWHKHGESTGGWYCPAHGQQL